MTVKAAEIGVLRFRRCTKTNPVESTNLELLKQCEQD